MATKKKKVALTNSQKTRIYKNTANYVINRGFNRGGIYHNVPSPFTMSDEDARVWYGLADAYAKKVGASLKRAFRQAANTEFLWAKENGL